MAQSKQDNGDQEYQPKWVILASRLLWNTGLITLCIALLLGLIKVLIIFSHRLDTRVSDPVQFVTGNLLNALIFVAIVAQVFIYSKQWHVMERQMAQASEHVAKVERPFVFLHAIRWEWHFDTARRAKYWYSIHPELSNSGNMPTQNMTINIRYDLRDTPLPEGFTFPISDTETGYALIPPKGQIRGAAGYVTDDQLLEIQKGTKFLYFWGEVKYRDAFEGTPIHTTHFCQFISKVLGQPLKPENPVDPKGTTVDIGFIFHREYNSAD